MRLSLAILIIATPALGQTVTVTCDDTVPPEQAVSVTCNVPLAAGVYTPYVEITVEDDPPPPPGETDFLQLIVDHGGAAWEFSSSATLGVPLVKNCPVNRDCTFDVDGAQYDPAVGVDGNGAVRFGPSQLLKGGSNFNGFDNGGPITILGFAHQEQINANSRIFDFKGGWTLPDERGLMLVTIRNASTGTNHFQIYTAHDPGDGGGFRSWPNRQSVNESPLGETYCYGGAWRPGEPLRIYFNGVEADYVPILGAPIAERGAGPRFGHATISQGGTLAFEGWQDRVYVVQADLTDEQVAEYCAQGGWQ